MKNETMEAIIASLRGGVPLTQASEQLGIPAVTARLRLKKMGINVKNLKPASRFHPTSNKSLTGPLMAILFEDATPFEVFTAHGITARSLISNM